MKTKILLIILALMAYHCKQKDKDKPSTNSVENKTEPKVENSPKSILMGKNLSGFTREIEIILEVRKEADLKELSFAYPVFSPYF